MPSFLKMLSALSHKLGMIDFLFYFIFLNELKWNYKRDNLKLPLYIVVILCSLTHTYVIYCGYIMLFESQVIFI